MLPVFGIADQHVANTSSRTIGQHISCIQSFVVLQEARVSKNTQFWSQARMFLTSGYALIVRVLVVSGYLQTFRSDISKKKDGCS